MYHTDAPQSETSAPALWTQWLHNGGIGWFLGLIPLSLVLGFATLLPLVTAGGRLRVAYPWVPTLGVNLSFMVDGLSLAFALIVSGVGLLIVVYAGGYMAGDPQLARFYLYLFLFMSAMLGLVLADNLVTLFVFWELTSITSFLLIGFKHQYESSRKAALQALLVTGGGGLALLAGLVLLGLVAGSWEISALVEQQAAIQASPFYGAILVLVLLGACTKSAQFPFQFWLPGAMAAPTPVSAYLHSATMVKAGVYLLARFSPILGNTPAWQLSVTTIGAITMVLGALLAVLQTDLKRILAFTTVSGLGMLTLLLGIGTEYAITAAIVFLIVHALYKAALFLVAGTLDHATGTRALAVLGGLRGAMPLTCIAAIIAAWSMSGFPPTVGFIGKEYIYEATLQSPLAFVILSTLAVASNILTLVAAGMVAVKPFFGPPASTPKHAHEAPLSMWLGPLVLAALGLLFGLFPATLLEPLVNQAVGAVQGSAAHVHLHLLPAAISTKVILSAITILAGIVLYYITSYAVPGILQRAVQPLQGVLEHSPERGYQAVVDGMQALARWQTRVLQHGYLRFYLFTVLITTVLLTGGALLSRADMRGLRLLPRADFYEWVIAGAMLLGAGLIVVAKSRLTAIVALGVVGYGISLLFILNGAPDLALTQFAIETLSVILFVLVLYRLPFFSTVTPRRDRIRDACLALALGGLMTTLVLAVTSYPVILHLTPYFGEVSWPLARGRNVVNVILVDFRGFDTLGEITVLSIGAIGIWTLMKLRPRPRAAAEGQRRQDEP